MARISPSPITLRTCEAILPVWESDRAVWRRFREPREVVSADRLDDIASKLERVERLVATGLCGVGFLAYEAAPAFDRALRTHPPGNLPLLWFGLYRPGEAIDGPEAIESETFSIGPWRQTITAARYRAGFDRIKEYIAAGDTYQVNYTVRLQARFRGDPWGLFVRLCRAQPSPYAAFLDTGRHILCSASPELFFHREGESLVSKPMKGTAPRGMTYAEDRAQRERLAGSEKDRAENAMIVDMIRNDLGRVARPGSIEVISPFTVERWPTVFQMISTVAARTAASGVEVLRALFPCASITGAPKVRTMEIIRELESGPRGVYTGCIGYLLPDRRARFNVAIRTVVVDRATGRAEYGSGGGIVWDSNRAHEYAECRTKARILMDDRPEFELLETILWEGSAGYFLLDRHLHRLSESAEYFDFRLDLTEVRRQLIGRGRRMGEVPHRVRLRVNRAGGVTVESSPLADSTGSAPWRLGVATEPIDRDNPFLYHKTTNRTVYESAATEAPDCDDIILWNRRGEVTETKIGNIVIEKNGRRYTPPVSCGLLAGVFRADLLARGEIEEKRIPLAELKQAQRVFMINSVRKWREAQVVES